MQKNNVLTIFIFTRTFFLIASYQILTNYVILIKHGLFFQERDSLQFNRFQFFKMNKLLYQMIRDLLE